jgi:hypothetical protein
VPALDKPLRVLGKKMKEKTEKCDLE